VARNSSYIKMGDESEVGDVTNFLVEHLEEKIRVNTERSRKSFDLFIKHHESTKNTRSYHMDNRGERGYSPARMWTFSD
jgi:hypothetical protein